jgi:hypothetical protein
MAKVINTPFKDAQYKPSDGGSDLEFEGGATLIEGDLEINGKKAVIGTGLHDHLKDPR